MKFTSLYSPPPVKVGEFDINSADDLFSSKTAWPGCVDNQKIDIPLDVLNISFGVRGNSLRPKFNKFSAAVEPAQHLPSLQSVAEWHFDEDKAGSPIRTMFGATIRQPDALKGSFSIPSNLYDQGNLLSDYIHSEDGQSSIEDSIARGNLEPVTTIEVGDVLLFDLYALHRRYPFLEQNSSRTRLTIRTSQSE
jgi:hypothetical protein